MYANRGVTCELRKVPLHLSLDIRTGTVTQLFPAHGNDFLFYDKVSQKEIVLQFLSEYQQLISFTAIWTLERYCFQYNLPRA